MIIIGLDPGCKTGWAICRDGKIVESGVQTFDLGRGESPGMRFLRFRRWLGELHNQVRGPVFVWAFERAHHRGGSATEIGVGLCTRIQEYAAEANGESLPVHTATLKKWATGSGKANKESMKLEAWQRTRSTQDRTDISQVFTDDNEADAVLIALWAWDQVGKIQPPAQGALA